MSEYQSNNFSNEMAANHLANHLANQVVLITGGSRGIGKAIASTCAAQGARVVISARSQAELDAAVAEIRESSSHRKVVGIACDVSDEKDVETMMQRVEEEVGPVY